MKKILIALIAIVLLVLITNVGVYFYLKTTGYSYSQPVASVVKESKAEKDIAALSGDVEALNDFDLSDIDSIEQSLSSVGNDLNGI